MSEDTIEQISANEAWDRLQNQPGACLVDVRTSAEFHFVGHPVGAVHLAWQELPDMFVDTAFVDKLTTWLEQQGQGKGTPLLMLCRSGARSQAAAEALSAAGYTNVANVHEGFEGGKDASGHRSTVSGWRFEGLPWEQS